MNRVIKEENVMFKSFLDQVATGQDLSRTSAEQAMQMIMSGQASEAQMGAFLTALRMKGETSAEIAGFAAVMRSHAERIDCKKRQLIDTCGTGGDKKGTFNVSTTTAFVLAGGGISVAKHGNRGVSSSCGSADVLTALGVRIDLPPQTVAKAIEEIDIGFLFAPCFHQAMKYAAQTRKDLGFRTVFNLLGPLTNPARATCQVIGVYDPALARKVAEALLELGTQRAMVVSSLDGMDEISTAASTQVVEITQGEIRTYLIDPVEYSFEPCSTNDYRGSDAAENATIIRKILQGQQGPKRDIVLMNAAAGFVVADRAVSLQEGIQMAAASIDSGAALAKLDALRDFSSKGEEESLLS
jgi:anthranilate phosphoribosyltransferase